MQQDFSILEWDCQLLNSGIYYNNEWDSIYELTVFKKKSQSYAKYFIYFTA
jgi:hypothetical protein